MKGLGYVILCALVWAVAFLVLVMLGVPWMAAIVGSGLGAAGIIYEVFSKKGNK